METVAPRGYSAVLKNRNFLALWLAQILSNTALNGAFFLQLILIEQVTQSTAHLGAVVLSFSLPAVFLSAIAGLVVDRVPKKFILIGSNGLRVITGAALAMLASFLLTNKLNEAFFLTAIYLLVFLTSAIGQFFAPAEGATIPLVVRANNLLPANSLFTLTFTASQILGMVLLAPLGVKTIGLVGSFWVATAMYVVATLLMMLIPRDQPKRVVALDGVSALRTAWNEIVDGWHFSITHRAIFIALLQLALVSTLTMILAELAPGFAARVLGLRPEDATYVFWPAGVGILLASVLIGRYGNHVSRATMASVGMFAMALAMIGLAWAGGGLGDLRMPLFQAHPELEVSTAALVMIFSLIAGAAMAAINIPAQTTVQEQSHDAVRGRVLAAQFTLSNALGIPPLLFIGNLADNVGIPRVSLFIALAIALLAGLNLGYTISSQRAAHKHSHSSDSTSSP